MSESIGATLKEARRRVGLRVRDVADLTSARISPSYLSCIENDLRLPSEELLLELAQILKLDRRELYLRLVRTKAPEFIRDEFFPPAARSDPRFDAVRELPLGEVVARAAEAIEARNELRRLRRELQTGAAGGRAATGSSYDAHWEEQAARYRMHIERTAVEAAITLEGDVVLERHVVGLTPRPGRPAILSLQHTARVPWLPGTSEDDDFKLLEQPADVALEVERRRLGPDRSLVRIVFPDGLAHEPGKDRRVSYTLRTRLRGAYRMEREAAPLVGDPQGDDRGGRGTVVVLVDKPCDELDLTVAFPRYYVPEGIEAWAGTQDFYEAEDNLIDAGVCAEWELEPDRDYRARLRVRRPQVGVKLGVVWRPIYREEFDRVKQQLQIEREEPAP